MSVKRKTRESKASAKLEGAKRLRMQACSPKPEGVKQLRMRVRSTKPEWVKQLRMQVQSTKPGVAKWPRMRAQSAKPEGTKRPSSSLGLAWRGTKCLARLVLLISNRFPSIILNLILGQDWESHLKTHSWPLELPCLHVSFNIIWKQFYATVCI